MDVSSAASSTASSTVLLLASLQVGGELKFRKFLQISTGCPASFNWLKDSSRMTKQVSALIAAVMLWENCLFSLSKKESEFSIFFLKT